MADLLRVGQMLPSPGVYGLLFPGGLPEMPCFRQAPTTPSAESGTVPWLAGGALFGPATFAHPCGPWNGTLSSITRIVA